MSFATPDFGLPNFSGMVARMKIQATPALAEAVRAAMEERDLLTHDEIRAAGGPSSPTMTHILNGDGATISRDTTKKLERALEWPPGSVTAIATGQGEAIRASREQAGLSRRDLARDLGVGRRSLAEWEAGGPIPDDILEQIRHVLAIAPYSEIIDELGRRDPHASLG